MEEARSGHEVRVGVRALAPIVLVAAIARGWGLWFGLPHTQARPDESVVAQIAIGFWKGDLDPKFFDYPTAFMYVLSAADLGYYAVGRLTGAFHSVAEFVASWKTNWPPFYLLGRALAAMLGTATVVVVARIAARVGGRASGLIAAVFIALSFLHVRDSHFLVTDVPATLLVCLSIDRLLAAHASRVPQRFFVAGVFAGLATATKYNAGFLVVPIVASSLIELVEARAEGRPSDAFRRLSLFGLPCLVFFLWGTPYAVLSPAGFREGLQRVSAHLAEGHGVDLGNGWIYHLTVSLRYGVGWPVLAAALVGAGMLAWRVPRTAVLLLAFPVAYFAAAGSGRTVFVRYIIPVVPFVCVTAAVAVSAVMRALPRVARIGPRVGPWLTAAATGIMLLPSAVNVARLDYLIARTDNRVVVADWLRERVPSGATLHQSSGSGYSALELGTSEQPVPLQLWDYDEFSNQFVQDGHPREGKPDWIVVERSPLAVYGRVPAAILRLVATDEYARVRSFQAVDLTVARVFDEQDAFFLPLDGFDGINRPGPNFDVYRRTRQSPIR